MMKAILSAMFAVSLIGICASDAQSYQMSRRLSLDVLNGNYTLPGSLLGMDKSLVEHPDHLSGEIRGLRASYALDSRNLIGATWIKISASGDGNWARSDTAAQLAENQVAGVVTGRTDMDLNGVTVDYEHRFLSARSLLRPYVRAGLGVGEMTVRFRGQFIGHETQSGYDFPVTNDADDLVKRTIPIVNLEVGVKVTIMRHLDLSIATYWNTGYGALGALGWKF